MTMNAEITVSKTEFAPGEMINGNVSWHSSEDVLMAEVRLFWQTRGKGTTDVAVAATETFANPRPTDERAFSFTAPPAPPSFSGQLISLVWGVELVLVPGGSVHRDIVIAPGGREIPLDNPEWLEAADPSAGAGRLRFGS